MSGTVRRVGIRLGLEGAREVERGLRDVGESGSRSLAQILRSSEAASAALRLLGPVLGGLSVGALAAFTLNAVRAVGGLGELAQQAGVSTDALQVLTFAAVGAGASAEEVQRGLAALTRQISDAAAGETAAAERFARLGIRFRDAAGNARNTEAVLADLADVIAGFSSPADQAAAATALLGDRLGQRLIPLLAQGRDGLEQVAERARRFGAVADAELIARADAAGDAIDELSTAFTRLAQNLAASVAPVLANVVQGFNRLVFGATAVERSLEIGRRVVTLGQQIAAAEEQLTRPLPGGTAGPLRARLERLRTEQAALIAESERLAREYEERQARLAAGGGTFGERATGGAGEAAARRARAERDIAALQAVFDRRLAVEQGYQQQLARIREGAEAGAIDVAQRATLEAQALRARDDALRQLETRTGAGAGTGSRSEVLAARERLLNELLRERTRLLEQNETPEEAYAARLERLGRVVEAFDGTELALPRPVIEREALAAIQEYEQALSRLEQTNDSVADAARELEGAFTSAFESAVLAAKDLQDVARALLQDLARLFLRQAFAGSGIGGVFNLLAKSIFSADGNVFDRGRVLPFARGGVLDGPIAFPLAGGLTGIAGEAGPEAIVPLARDRQGRLGIRAEGSGGAVVVNQTINLNVSGGSGGGDPAEQQRMAREIGRLARAGVLEALREQQRPGGLLRPGLAAL
jgi:hypothetical protein